MASSPPPYLPLVEDPKDLHPSLPAGQQYYAQPAPGAAGPYYGAPYQPVAAAPTQQLIINQAPAVIMQPIQHVRSYCGHIVFSCFVFWCCGGLFGLIAFILAVIAQCQTASSPQNARQLGVASVVLSVIGIFVGIILIVVLIVLFAVVGVTVEQHMEQEASSGCTDIFGSEMCQ